jgi:hypothetical protein
VIRLAVGERVYVYHGSGERVVLAAGEAGQEISVPGDQPVPPVPGEATFSRVEIAGTGLSFEVPNGWFRIEPEWAWMPPDAQHPGEESALRLGGVWTDLQPPIEPEAALLPQPSQVLYSEEATLSWGQGQRFLVEVYGPAAQGSDAQAPVESVELHVLVVVDRDGARRAFDLYARGASMEDLGTLEPLLQRMLDSSRLEGVEPQTQELPPVMSEGQDPETGWQTLADSAHGFRLNIPQDWTWKELPAAVPGMPEDWPVTRIVHLFPQAWEASLNRSGPPDPTAKPVVAPLQIEVVVGPPEQFRRVYPEPTSSEAIEINGVQVLVEREVFDPMWLARYVYQDPEHPEVSVVVGDYLSGFPDRVEGNEALIELLPAILSTFEFAR